MFVLGNFISSLAYLLNIVLNVLIFFIVIRALISWFSPDPFNPLVIFLHRVTEPILEPIRRLLPQMPLDLSPLIAFFGITFLNNFLVATLYELAQRMH